MPLLLSVTNVHVELCVYGPSLVTHTKARSSNLDYEGFPVVLNVLIATDYKIKLSKLMEI